jgi:acyl-CoA-binding protein
MTTEENNELIKKFNKYSEIVKNFEDVTNDDKLYLYSHYKQSIIGNNINDKPSIFNRIEMEKWKAWNNLIDMDKEDAMKKYINKVKQIYKNK